PYPSAKHAQGFVAADAPALSLAECLPFGLRHPEMDFFARTVRVRDLDRGALLQRLPGGVSIVVVAFDRDPSQSEPGGKRHFQIVVENRQRILHVFDSGLGLRWRRWWFRRVGRKSRFRLTGFDRLSR